MNGRMKMTNENSELTQRFRKIGRSFPLLHECHWKKMVFESPEIYIVKQRKLEPA